MTKTELDEFIAEHKKRKFVNSLTEGGIFIYPKTLDALIDRIESLEGVLDACEKRRTRLDKDSP